MKITEFDGHVTVTDQDDGRTDVEIVAQVYRYCPQRGDAVEAWLKRKRDQLDKQDMYGRELWYYLDALLDDYRLHADTGTSLDQNVLGPHEETEVPLTLGKGGPKIGSAKAKITPKGIEIVGKLDKSPRAEAVLQALREDRVPVSFRLDADL